MPLPRQDFWEKGRAVVEHYRDGYSRGFSHCWTKLEMQTLQKRQANIRRTAAELARKRLVAMVQHAATMSLRTEGGAQGQDLAALDWGRHDSSERQFYNNINEELSRFKQEVDWTSMQIGLASEEIGKMQTLAPGTTQLDSFVEDAGGLTGQGPPAIALEDKTEPLPEPEIDEEDLLAKAEEFPELEGLQPSEPEKGQTAPTTLPEGRNHVQLQWN